MEQHLPSEIQDFPFDKVRFFFYVSMFAENDDVSMFVHLSGIYSLD